MRRTTVLSLLFVFAAVTAAPAASPPAVATGRGDATHVRDGATLGPIAGARFVHRHSSAGVGGCVDRDGDGYGSPGDPSCPAGAAEDCDDTSRVCGTDCRFELCAAPVGLDTVLAVDDVDGDGTGDLLIALTDPATATTTLDLYSPDGRWLRSIGVNPAYLPAAVGLAGNVGGTPAFEVAVLGVRDDALALVQLRDAASGGVVSNVFFPGDIEPRDVESLDGWTGTPGPLIAMLGFSTVAGRGQLLLKRIATGGVVGSIVSHPAYDPKALEILPDTGGTAAPDAVILGQNPATGLVLAQVRDLGTGQRLRNIFFSTIDLVLGMTVVEGIPGAGPAIGVFGHHGGLDRIVLELRDATTGSYLRTLASHPQFPATQVDLMPTYTGTSAPEAVFAGQAAGDGPVLVQSRDAGSGNRLDNVFLGSGHDVRSIATRVTLDGEPRWEVVALGRDLTTGTPRVEIRDVVAGTLVGSFHPVPGGRTLDGEYDVAFDPDDGCRLGPAFPTFDSFLFDSASATLSHAAGGGGCDEIPGTLAGAAWAVSSQDADVFDVGTECQVTALQTTLSIDFADPFALAGAVVIEGVPQGSGCAALGLGATCTETASVSGGVCDGCGPICEVACGDGQLTPDEECDDGNTFDGDGCSSTCLVDLSGDYALSLERLSDDECGFDGVLQPPYAISIEQLAASATLVQEPEYPGLGCTVSEGEVVAGALEAMGSSTYPDWFFGGCSLTFEEQWSLQRDETGSLSGEWQVTGFVEPDGCIGEPGAPLCTNRYSVAGQAGGAPPVCP